MDNTAAEAQTIHRCPVATPAWDRSHAEQLMLRLAALKNIATS